MDDPEMDDREIDDRERGLRLVREMIPTAAVDFDHDVVDRGFGSEMADLTLANVFGRLWARGGLDRRSRSLVTLGILIALGATEELEIHVAVAQRNGLTRTELEEVLYHATGYAGFPRAAAAYRVARDVVDGPADPGREHPAAATAPDAAEG